MIIYLTFLVLRFIFYASIAFVKIFFFLANHVVYILPRAMADTKLYKYIIMMSILYIVQNILGDTKNLAIMFARWYILYLMFASFVLFILVRIYNGVAGKKNRKSA